MSSTPYNGANINPHINGYTNGTKPTMEQLRAASVLPQDAEDSTHTEQAIQGEQPEYHFQPLTLAQLVSLPPKQWDVENLFGPGDVGAFFGPPDSAKTFSVISLCMSACSGKRFAHRFDVRRPLNVAYCAGEGLSGLAQRFAAAAMHHRLPSDSSNFSFFPIVPQLFDRNSPDAIARFVQDWTARQVAGKARPLDLIVIDTQHSATIGTDENATKDAGLVLEAIKASRRELAPGELGPAFLLIHHVSKAGGYRGSTSMPGAFDFMVEFKKVKEGKFSMHCFKLKDGKPWEPQGLTLVSTPHYTAPYVQWDGPLTKSATDQPKTSKVKSDIPKKILLTLADNQSQPLTRKQVGEIIGASPAAVGNHMPDLVEAGLVTEYYDDTQVTKVLVGLILPKGLESLKDVVNPF